MEMNTSWECRSRSRIDVTIKVNSTAQIIKSAFNICSDTDFQSVKVDYPRVLPKKYIAASCRTFFIGTRTLTVLSLYLASGFLHPSRRNSWRAALDFSADERKKPLPKTTSPHNPPHFQPIMQHWTAIKHIRG